MKKLLAFAISTGLFVSCNNSMKEVDQQNKIENDSLCALFKNVSIPFILDTNVLYKLEGFDSLGSNVIKQLAKEIDTSEFTKDNLYTLNTFYQIDSIKTTGKYKQYCDSLDVGMPKNATARALYKIQLDSSTVAYVWGIHYDSYEACPNTTANSAFISIRQNNKITETFCLGNAFWFADPPNMANEWTYTSIEKNKTVLINTTRTVDDIDDSLAEEVTHQKLMRTLKH